MILIGSICLSEIPKELFKKSDNGKVYLNLSIFTMKDRDRYGNEFTASCAPKKGERIDGVNYYCGKFKELTKHDPTPEEVSKMESCNDEDLPF